MNVDGLLRAGVLIAVLSGCASSPDPLLRTEIQELQADVIAIDQAARTVVIRGPSGDEMELRVGPEVRNFAQIEVGDVLRVSYYTAMLVSMAEPGVSSDQIPARTSSKNSMSG